MTSEAFQDSLRQSERVGSLLATAIRAGVKIELGIAIDERQARDFARTKTVGTAIAVIRKKLQLHAHVDDNIRLRLAIVEASIESGDGSVASTDTIIKIRRQTHELINQASNSRAKSWQDTENRLVSLEDEIVTWSDNARRFFRSVNQLYRTRQRQLKDLNLPENILAEALKGLDSLCVGAIDQFLRLG